MECGIEERENANLHEVVAGNRGERLCTGVGRASCNASRRHGVPSRAVRRAAASSLCPAAARLRPATGRGELRLSAACRLRLSTAGALLRICPPLCGRAGTLLPARAILARLPAALRLWLWLLGPWLPWVVAKA